MTAGCECKSRGREESKNKLGFGAKVHTLVLENVWVGNEKGMMGRI